MINDNDKPALPDPIMWSYDDPESCTRAMNAALSDSEFVAETMRVYRDFEITLADGLGDEDWSDLVSSGEAAINRPE